MARQVPIGLRLRAARLRNGMTLEAVATIAGISQGFVSKLERDQVSPSVATLVAICDAVGLRVGELFESPPAQIVRAGQGSPINFGGRGASEFRIARPNIGREPKSLYREALSSSVVAVRPRGASIA